MDPHMKIPARILAPVRFVALLPKALLLASANAAVGGQAVMEGVMMRSPNHWAVALRRRDGEIVEIHRTHKSFGRRHAWARLPILRGVVALGESLAIGFRALSVSAHYAAEWIEEEYAEPEPDFSIDPEGPEFVGTDKQRKQEIKRQAKWRANEAKAAAKAEKSNVIALERPKTDDGAVAVSATADTPETDDPTSAASPDSLKTWQIVLAFIFAIGFSIALFKLLPALLTNYFLVDTKSGGFVFAEAAVRISIFCGYLALVGLLPDMRRVFQYHSAEHKAINAWENGIELTPELVNEQSRIHVRCGTAFMLWVFVVAIGVFGAFGYYVHPSLPEVIASRILLLPLIAGISFELIKFAGKYPNSRVLRGVLAPGLWLQYLTTRQCTPEQCEVAIRSLNICLEHEYPDASVEEALVELQDDDEAMQVMA